MTRDRLSYVLKSAIAHGLYRLGVFHVWCRLALKHRAVVLTYHRVLPDATLEETWSHPAIIVRRRTFDRHLHVLTRFFQVLSLSQFVSHVRSGQPFDRPSCLITFDDGWRDTYTEAWPLLKAHGVPAVVFLPADFIGSSRVFWQEELGAVLYQALQEARRDFAFAERLRTAVTSPALDALLATDEATSRDAVRRYVNSLKLANGQDPRALVERLRAILGPAAATAAVDGFMDWHQVRHMAQDSVSFGGHGRTHRILTRIPEAEAAEEVAASRAALNRELGQGSFVAFSYPNGDWNAAIAESVRAAGFEVAFSTARGTVAPGDPVHGLRRINVHEDVTGSAPMLLARIVGLF